MSLCRKFFRSSDLQAELQCLKLLETFSGKDFKILHLKKTALKSNSTCIQSSCQTIMKALLFLVLLINSFLAYTKNLLSFV